MLDRWCERGILGLTLCILVFGPVAAGAVGVWEYLVIQGLTISVVGLWGVRIWIQGNYRLLWPPICWLVIAFTAYAIVRYQFAEIEYVARGELIRVLTYAFLFFVVVNNLHSQESTQTCVFALIFLGMTVSLYSIYQFITNSPYVWHLLGPEIKPEQYMKRASGTFICPNNFAGFLEMLVPLGLAMTLKGRFQPTTRVLLGYASVAMLAGIGVSVSRGGWIATGAALLVLFAILVRYRDSRLPAIAFLVLLFGLGAVFLKQGYQAQKRWHQMFLAGGDVFDERIYIWKSAVEIWKGHPWVGAGPAHFDEVFPQYRPEIVQLRPGRAHNDYLNTLADWGVIGAGLVASAILFLIWGIGRTWRFVQRSGDLVAKPSSRAAFVLGAAVGLLAISIHSMTDFNMHIPANAIVAISLMAMLSGYVRFATERYWVTMSWVTRVFLTVALVVGIGYLGQQGMKRVREQRMLDHADAAQKSGQTRMDALSKIWKEADAGKNLDWGEVDRLSAEYQKQLLEQIDFRKQAHAIDPNNFETTYRIGEIYRDQAWQRGQGYQELALKAMSWFSKGMSLNPYNSYNFARYGMCLDLLGRASGASRYFKRALELDPKSYYIVALMGWHFFNIEDYAQSKRWFEESRRLWDWRWNQMAASYLPIIEQRLKEQKP